MSLTIIEATTLQDAWFQTLYRLLDEGQVFKIDQGSYAGEQRLEFFYVVINIKHPEVRPLLPQIPAQYGIPNPVADDYLDKYAPYLMTDHMEENESYTYGSRLTKAQLPKDYVRWRHNYIRGKITDEACLVHPYGAWESPYIIKREREFPSFVNQIEWIIWAYKHKGHRNNQMILQVGEGSDITLKDPPCLRHIDTRIEDGKLHFFPYFRSWDAFSGMPANLAAIQLLKEYMAGQIGVEDGTIVASSKGLHVYSYAFDLVKCLRMKEDMKLKEGRT